MKFNKYAKELDNLTRKLLKKVAIADADVELAYEYARQNPIPRITGIVDARTAQRVATGKEARERLDLARRSLSRTKADAKMAFARGKADLDEKFVQALDEYYSMSPESVDPATLSLIDSGMLKDVRDFEKLFAKFENNPTMLRFLSGEAMKRADEVEKSTGLDDDTKINMSRELRKLALMDDGRRQEAALLREWKDLLGAAEVVLASEKTGLRTWEAVTTEAIKRFGIAEDGDAEEAEEVEES